MLHELNALPVDKERETVQKRPNIRPAPFTNHVSNSDHSFEGMGSHPWEGDSLTIEIAHQIDKSTCIKGLLWGVGETIKFGVDSEQSKQCQRSERNNGWKRLNSFPLLPANTYYQPIPM